MLFSNRKKRAVLLYLLNLESSSTAFALHFWSWQGWELKPRVLTRPVVARRNHSICRTRDAEGWSERWWVDSGPLDEGWKSVAKTTLISSCLLSDFHEMQLWWYSKFSLKKSVFISSWWSHTYYPLIVSAADCRPCVGRKNEKLSIFYNLPGLNDVYQWEATNHYKRCGLRMLSRGESRERRTSGFEKYPRWSARGDRHFAQVSVRACWLSDKNV